MDCIQIFVNRILRLPFKKGIEEMSKVNVKFREAVVAEFWKQYRKMDYENKKREMGRV